MQRAAAYKRIVCPAKLNLVLRVGPRKANGYHDLETLMVPVRWGDELSLSIRPASQNKISLVCPGLRLPPGKNLAYRAAEAFRTAYLKSPVAIRIRLKKVVPTGAGLGGGSSDAAMVLRLLAKACGVKVNRKLIRIATTLGADVPFFLRPQPSWCTGVGEICRPLKLKQRFYFVLVLSPKTPVPTGWAYQTLDQWRAKNRIRTRLLGLPSEWMNPEVVIPELENHFEPLVILRKPVLGHVKAAIARSGAMAAAMSGSGSAFFGVFLTRSAALAAARDLKRKGFWAVFTEGFVDKGQKAF